MKTFLIKSTMAVAVVLLVNLNGFSQVSLGLQGGLAKSNRENSKTIAGGGANLRFFASPNLALGVAGKIYADGTDYTVAGQTLSFNGRVTPVTGTIDYFFSQGILRPYVGGDAGVYFSKYDAKYNGNTVAESSKHSNFGAAPRVGLLFAFGNVGIQVEGIYHFVFGNKSNSATTGSANNVDFESTSQFGGVNVGIVFGLPGSK